MIETKAKSVSAQRAKWLESTLFDLLMRGYTRAEIEIVTTPGGRTVVKARGSEWGWQPLWQGAR